MTTPTDPPGGQQWTIRSGAWEATLTEVGGGLRTLSYAGRDVVAGYPEGERSADGRGQVLAPWPNRVGDGRFTWAGREHQLPLTEVERRTALHGLVAWLRWEVVDQAPDRIRLEVVVSAQPGWEWPFRLRVTYALEDTGLTVTPEVTNFSGESMPFAYGAHPYLTAGEALVDDVDLLVPATAHLKVDDERRLPEPDAVPTDIPAALDAGRWRPVGEAQFDDAFTDLHVDDDGCWRVRLRHADRETVLWAEQDLRWVQLFTGDDLTAGASRRSGVAVEPMTAPPDALRTGTDLLAIAPGDSWSSRWGIGATVPEEEARSAFSQAFDGEPSGVWMAPGRVNLIGEHTDYNGGFVLPLALSRRCLVAAAPAAGERSRVVSTIDLDDVVEFDAAAVAPGDVTGWAAYVAGMAWSLRGDGHDVPQVDLVVHSDVPLGAGLSSSAALECATGLALLDLAGVDLEPTPLARLAQRCENDFVGAATGLMDQLASVHGQDGRLVFIDTATDEVQPIPFDLAAAGLALLVVDTRAPHSLVDGQYEARRRACEAGASTLGVTQLREVGVEDLDEALPRLDPETARRVRHVVTENARVLEVVSHLGDGGDPRGIGAAMTASHESLRDDFEVTVPHLDVAVEAALSAGAHGARMTGGGFGGSIIALVEAADVVAVTRAVERAYAERGFGPPVAFVARPSEGATRLR